MRSLMREVVLDTETTGISVREGNRIIEIGCVELEDRLPTGQIYHAYLNPGDIVIPPEIVKLTGLDNDFLQDFPTFEAQVEDFCEFIQDSPLVIHNAPFDVGFLNAELQRVQRPDIPLSRAIDTLLLARRKFPGAPANLDALSKRFNIRIPRDKHGALLDAQILAEVYVELMGGRQRSFTFDLSTARHASRIPNTTRVQNFPQRSFPLREDERQSFLKALEKIHEPLWEQMMPEEKEEPYELLESA